MRMPISEVCMSIKVQFNFACNQFPCAKAAATTAVAQKKKIASNLAFVDKTVFSVACQDAKMADKCHNCLPMHRQEIIIVQVLFRLCLPTGSALTLMVHLAARRPQAAPTDRHTFAE